MNEADKCFKKAILSVVEDTLSGLNISYEICHYTSEGEDKGEIMHLSELYFGHDRIVVSDDFALVVISDVQYDFEEWRFKDIKILLNELKELLIKKLS